MVDPTEHRALSMLLIVFISIIVRKIYLSVQSRRLAKSLGCEPAVDASSDPLGLIFFLKLDKAAREGTRIQFHDSLYKRYGPTLGQKIPVAELLLTCDPENIKAILATQFHDFGLNFRSTAFRPLLGHGIFNSRWSGVVACEKFAASSVYERPGIYILACCSHLQLLGKRNKRLTYFARLQVADLQLMDEHIAEFMRKLPKDRSLFDIQPLFFAFANDSSTHFLFGESLARMNSSSGTSDAAEFNKAFGKALEWMSRRVSAQKLSFLMDGNKEYTSATKYVHDIADHYVRLALQSRGQEKKSDRYVFLQTLANDTQDPKVLRDNVLNLLIAGRDTTASLLSSTLFYLSHALVVWKRLRAEIIDEYGDALNPTGEVTHASIKNMRYLRYVLNEGKQSPFFF